MAPKNLFNNVIIEVNWRGLDMFLYIIRWNFNLPWGISWFLHESYDMVRWILVTFNLYFWKCLHLFLTITMCGRACSSAENWSFWLSHLTFEVLPSISPSQETKSSFTCLPAIR